MTIYVLVGQGSWPNDLKRSKRFKKIQSESCTITHHDVTTFEVDELV